MLTLMSFVLALLILELIILYVRMNRFLTLFMDGVDQATIPNIVPAEDALDQTPNAAPSASGRDSQHLIVNSRVQQ